ncbi:hypothetical protein U9M48_028370 [Paspalum notatum var. saurae]|uniref:Uncharacterized protein n=1 Tax=Paspalum notatum var. saurae TaxID=547442 RepID=A0AAQ3X0I3_PASNO
MHSCALMTAPFMHIDSAIEEETVQEQPLIEEFEEEQENQQPTTDPAAEETNPSEEEGTEFLFYAYGRVPIRNEKSHDLARSGISGLDARSIYANSANEGPTQKQQRIKESDEEPLDQELVNQQQEDQQLAPSVTPETTPNFSKKGWQDHALPS